MKRTVAMTTLWIATAVLAAGGATTALAAGSGSSGTKVLTRTEVAARLKSPPVAQTKITTANPNVLGAKPVDGKEFGVKVNGGTIFLTCHGDYPAKYRVVASPGWTATIQRVLDPKLNDRVLGMFTTAKKDFMNVAEVGCAGH
jgi:hypothetical protein